MSNWPNSISLKGAQTNEKKVNNVTFPFAVWTIIYAALAHGDPQHQPEQEFAQIPQRTVLIEGRRWQANVVPALNKKGEEVLAVLVAAVPVANSGKKEQRWAIPVAKLRKLKFGYNGVVFVPLTVEVEPEEEAPAPATNEEETPQNAPEPETPAPADDDQPPAPVNEEE